MYSEKGQVHACTQPMENEPSSPPTRMLVGEVTESLDGIVSQISLYCVRGVGQLLEVFLMVM